MFVYQKAFLTNQLNQIILKLLSQVKICFVMIIFYILKEVVFEYIINSIHQVFGVLTYMC